LSYGALIILALQSAAFIGLCLFYSILLYQTAISHVLIFILVAWLEAFIVTVSLCPAQFSKQHYQGFRVFNEQESIIQLPEWVGTALEIGLFYGTTLILWDALLISA
jgi:hypothetical protein